MAPFPDPSKIYYIKNHYLGQYLALNEFDLIVERSRVADGRHQWRFVRVQGGYYIQNVATKKFLAIRYRKTADGTEDAEVHTGAQTFGVRAQGNYWLIDIKNSATNNTTYYLNCYINVFDFCNYNAYTHLNGCKEGSRRQWTIEE